MKKIPLLLLTGSLLGSVGFVHAQSNPNTNNYQSQTYTQKASGYVTPKGWDGVGKPDHIPAGDNPKWYDNAAPTNSAYGNDYAYRWHENHHAKWKKHHHEGWKHDKINYKEDQDKKDWNHKEHDKDQMRVTPENREFQQFHKNSPQATTNKSSDAPKVNINNNENMNKDMKTNDSNNKTQ